MVFVGLGVTLIITGAFFELVGAIGVLKLPNFFMRLHALTVSCIGGSVLPLIGVVVLTIGLEEIGSQRLFIMGVCLISAFIILVLAPSGSHSLARAAYFSNAAPKQPLEYDALIENYKVIRK
jgi:monovalent cation/proton antiporter, MnhG/PhaG subunit